MSRVLETLIVLRAVDKASAGFRKAFGSANAMADAFARKQKGRADRWRDTAIAAGATATAIGAMLYAPTKLAVDFEQAIANVGAVSGATSAQMKAMGEAARAQGRITMFTASQSAEAMQYLAMAGLNANQTIGALPGVLDLAAAGNLNLAETADIATNIMSAFGMKVSDMTRIGDVLTRTFTSSNSTLETIAATMKYTGPIAKEAGLGLEETAAMAGVLANAGIKGQMAGTSLRGMLLRLAGKTKPAAAALKELGLNTVDSQGNLRDLTVVLAEMGRALDGVPSGRKLELIKTMFETEGTSGAAKLLTFAKDGGLARYTQDIKGEGERSTTAKEVAERRMDTAMGSLLKFRSAVEDLGIGLGNALLPTLTALATSAATSANALADWTGENQGATATIVKSVAAIGGLAAALAVIASVISSVATIAGALAPVIVFVGTAFTGVTLAASATIAALIAIPAAMLYYRKEIADAAAGIGKWVIEGLTGVKADEGPRGTQEVNNTDRNKSRRQGDARMRAANPFGFNSDKSPALEVVPKSDGGPLSQTFAPKEKLNPNRTGSNTSVTYSPVINMPAGSPADKQSFREMLREHSGEVIKLMDRAQGDRNRLSFG